MKLIDHLFPGAAVLMAIAAGLNLAVENYPDGIPMVIASLLINYAARSRSWLAGYEVASREHIECMKRLLKKKEEAEKQEPPEDWWKRES